jgi:AcrR family transcriptional regulator
VDTQKRSTEELILEAAHAVFLEKGLAGARMQEIADRAGINKALLHYYFRSKEKLSALIIDRAISVILPRVMAVLDTDVELFDKIRLVVDHYLTFVSRNSFLPLFIVNEVNRNPQFFFRAVVEKERRTSTNSVGQVEEAVAQGRIHPISSAQLFMNVMSLVIFPFLGKPIIQVGLGLSDEDFKREMKHRRTEVAEFVIRAIRA